MPVRKRERGSGMWGASRTVDEAGVWWAGQCGRPGLVGGARMWRVGAVVSRCGSSAPHCGVGMDWHWGRKRVTGAGNGALGQANYLPQWVFSCPNAYSPI